MKSIIMAAALSLPSAALACGESSWTDGPFQVPGISDGTIEWDGRFIPIDGNSGPFPAAGMVAEHLTVVVTDAAGVPVAGAFADSLTRNTVLWVADEPLAVGWTGRLSISAEGSDGPEEFISSLEVVEANPGVPELTLVAELYDQPLFGETCVTYGDCYCGEYEVIGSEVRFRLPVQLGLPVGLWDDVRMVRSAVGRTAEEAFAALDAATFQYFPAELRIGGPPPDGWDIACGAVEVAEVDGARRLRDVQCVEVPAGLEPEMPGAEEGAAAKANDGGGCQASPGGGGGWALGLLAGLGLWRRRIRQHSAVAVR